MSEEEKKEGDKSLVSKVVLWGSGGFLTLATIFGGAAPFVGESVIRGAMDHLVAQLDTIYNIRPMPEVLLPMLMDAEQIKHDMDSAIGFHGHYIAYQQGVNALVLNNCEVVEMDGISFYNDTCNKTLWTIQNKYIYQAIKQGSDWYYFPYQWQIREGESNRIKITNNSSNERQE